MRPLAVVPVEVLGNVGACAAHAVVGHEVHPLVRFGEVVSRELATPLGVDDLWRAVSCKSLFDDLLGMAASSVTATVWVNTRRLATSTAVR